MLAALARTLHAVSPLPTLERGYSVTLSADHGETLRSVSQAKIGETILTRLADGRIRSRIDVIEPEPLADSTSPTRD